MPPRRSSSASLGSLESGKPADIAAVEGDPISDIHLPAEKKNIQAVMKEGKVYADRGTGAIEECRQRAAGKLENHRLSLNHEGERASHGGYGGRVVMGAS